MSQDMSFEDVCERARQYLDDVDLSSHLERYQQESAGANVPGFIDFLRNEKVIDTVVFAELHAGGPVEVTQLLGDASLADAGADDAADPSPDPADDPLAFLATQLGQSLSGGPDGADQVSADAETTDPDPQDAGQAGDGTDGDSGRQNYQVLGLLGKGAMGEVHLARDVYLRRRVALKNIMPSMAARMEIFARFLSEMQITSQLDHPNIVPVYGIEISPDGTLAYAMKLVQGQELAELFEETRGRIEKGKPLEEKHRLGHRLECFLKVCDAVSFAHDKGIIHRDLKPANIMIGRYKEVYLMDWGISRLIGEGGKAADAGVELLDATGGEDDLTRTRIGTAIGTPTYMSPEQAAGRNSELDGRSDMYTLGLILQELLTLRRALQGTTLKEVVTNAKEGRKGPPEPVSADLSVPRELRAIINKATQLEPEDRYDSVAELAADIRRFMRNEEILAQPDSLLQKMGRWVSNNRTAAMAIMALTLLLGAATTIGTLVYEQRAIAKLHDHELKLSNFLLHVSTHAHHVDKELHSYEAELEHLVGAAEEVITHAESSTEEVHFEPDFLGKGDAPNDLARSRYYKKDVSVEWPVFLVAPGADRAALMPELRKLEFLRPIFRVMMLDSHHDNPHVLSEQAQRRIIAQEGAPIHRVFVSLADGAHVSYPGMAGFPKGYEPRQRPYYKLSENRVGIHWGKPFADVHGHGLVVACSAALYDEHHKFRGVAGFEVTLNYLVETFLDIAELPYLEESMLVDAKGMVLVHKVHAGMEEKVKHLHQNQQIDLRPLPLPTVVAAIKRRENGYQEIDNNGDSLLVAYSALNATGWYYVAIADRVMMMAGPAGTTEVKEDFATTSSRDERTPAAPSSAASGLTASAGATVAASGSATASSSASTSESASMSASKTASHGERQEGANPGRNH